MRKHSSDFFVKILSKILSSKSLSFPRRVFVKFLAAYLRTMHRRIGIEPSIGSKVSASLNEIRKEGIEILLSEEAAAVIYSLALVASFRKIGDMAEVGVYQGGSARLICEVKGDKPLHLFDTFAGLPKVNNELDKPYCEGQYSAPLEKVKQHLAKYENTYFYKGFFPATAKSIEDKQFSFVHVDVDIYESTLNCLKFFYPRMLRGGVIITHDYLDEGIRKAFEEFFQDKPESIIGVSACQCLVVKV